MKKSVTLKLLADDAEPILRQAAIPVPREARERFTRLSACTSACKEMGAKLLEIGWRKSVSGGDNRLH